MKERGVFRKRQTRLFISTVSHRFWQSCGRYKVPLHDRNETNESHTSSRFQSVSSIKPSAGLSKKGKDSSSIEYGALMTREARKLLIDIMDVRARSSSLLSLLLSSLLSSLLFQYFFFLFLLFRFDVRSFVLTAHTGDAHSGKR